MPCLIALCLLTAPLFSQQPAALGDIARQLRGKKSNLPESLPLLDRDQQDGSIETIIGVDTLAKANQDAVSRYRVNVEELFNHSQFDQLDQLASKARTGKERFPGGGWKLSTLYLPLMNPPDSSPNSDWEALITRLKAWVSQKPDSITARVALAGAYVNYAWKGRTDNYAYKVTDDQWELFEQRLRLASKTLVDASALIGKCPEWYRQMQQVALGQGWPRQQTAELFTQAIAFEPDYEYYYRAYAYYLLPKWEGEEGESEAFAEEISDKVGGERGNIIYYEIATEGICNCDDGIPLKKMSWVKIQKGYAALERIYGVTTLKLNRFAYLASQKNDPFVARTMFLRIGDNWDEETWKTKAHFDECRQWALRAANDWMVATSAVQTNLQTAEGQQYDVQIAGEFPQKIAAIMKQCVEQAGDDTGNFRLFLKLAEQGSPTRFLARPRTAVSECLRPQVKAMTFSRPPKQDHWVKIDMNIVP